MSDFKPTEEQVAILDLFREGKSIAVQAGAGCGKTASVVMLAESAPTRTGVFTAFNKAIVTDAASRLPSNTAASTIHSIAFRAVGKQYGHRLRNAKRMKSMDIARLLRIDPLTVTYGTQRKPMAAGYLAGLAMRSVKRFCQSGDLEPTEAHVPYIDGIDVPTTDGRRTYSNNNQVRAHVMAAVRKAWADLQSVDGQLPYDHGAYVKMFANNQPRILADFILVDECSDLNGVMMQILDQQTDVQKILVGDSAQQINKWMGSIDALTTAQLDATAYLTNSFRFGPAIADVANGLLERLGTELRLTGVAPWMSVVGPVAEPDCILTRTNATAVRQVLEAQEQGRKPYLMGGGSDLVAFARAAQDLMDGRWVSHPELACFQDWTEVRNYVDHDAQGDELSLMVKLIEQYGTATIIKALSGLGSQADADVVVSTAHKSKGLQFDSVQLTADFPAPKDGATDSSADDLMLAYVAVSRAKRELDVTAVPHALAAPEGSEDPLVLPVWLQTDDAPVSVPAAPQEPTATHKACPLCGRTDIIRGGLVGAHRCQGATA